MAPSSPPSLRRQPSWTRNTPKDLINSGKLGKIVVEYFLTTVDQKYEIILRDIRSSIETLTGITFVVLLVTLICTGSWLIEAHRGPTYITSIDDFLRLNNDPGKSFKYVVLAVPGYGLRTMNKFHKFVKVRTYSEIPSPELDRITNSLPSRYVVYSPKTTSSDKKNYKARGSSSNSKRGIVVRFPVKWSNSVVGSRVLDVDLMKLRRKTISCMKEKLDSSSRLQQLRMEEEGDEEYDIQQYEGMNRADLVKLIRAQYEKYPLQFNQDVLTPCGVVIGFFSDFPHGDLLPLNERYLTQKIMLDATGQFFSVKSLLKYLSPFCLCLLVVSMAILRYLQTHILKQKMKNENNNMAIPQWAVRELRMLRCNEVVDNKIYANFTYPQLLSEMDSFVHKLQASSDDGVSPVLDVGKSRIYYIKELKVILCRYASEDQDDVHMATKHPPFRIIPMDRVVRYRSVDTQCIDLEWGDGKRKTIRLPKGISSNSSSISAKMLVDIHQKLDPEWAVRYENRLLKDEQEAKKAELKRMESEEKFMDSSRTIEDRLKDTPASRLERAQMRNNALDYEEWLESERKRRVQQQKIQKESSGSSGIKEEEKKEESSREAKNETNKEQHQQESDLKECTFTTLCAICQDDFGEGDIIVRWPCVSLHSYHEDCALKWARKRNTCPLCRFEIQAAPSERGFVYGLLNRALSIQRATQRRSVEIREGEAVISS